MLGADDALMYLSDPAQALPNLLTSMSGVGIEPHTNRAVQSLTPSPHILIRVCHAKPSELTAPGTWDKAGTMRIRALLSQTSHCGKPSGLWVLSLPNTLELQNLTGT